MTPDAPSNTRALLIFTTYLTTNTLLTLLIVTSIYNASLQASTKCSTRKLVVLISLSVASLAVTWHYMTSFFGLSYRSWAYENEVQLPLTPSSISVTALVDYSRQIKLGAWLRDVKLFREAWETVVEAPGRICWSMPIFFITTAWSLFLAKEAQVRNIKHAWAYMVLGQLVAISFAMNLFYIAILVNPSPSDPTVSRISATSKKEVAKTNGRLLNLWTPPAIVYDIILLITFVGIAATNTTAGHEHFLLILAVPHIALLVPPLLHQFLPSQLGIKHGSKTSYDRFYTSKFWYVRAAAILYESVALYFALYAGLTEERHAHRHSNVEHYRWQGELVSESPVQSLVRSLQDHPAVSSVGWDSILCTASSLTWIAWS